MIIGNIALVQVQATVAAFTVSLFAIGVGQGMEKAFNFNNAMVVVASAMFTATSSCFVLDFFLIAMVLTSIKLKMNPDNLATPLAASIGDVVSITVFSFIASLLYKYHGECPQILSLESIAYNGNFLTLHRNPFMDHFSRGHYLFHPLTHMDFNRT